MAGFSFPSGFPARQMKSSCMSKTRAINRSALSLSVPGINKEQNNTSVNNSLATQCIVGLGEGLKFVRAKTTAAIREHENAIYRRVRNGLLSIPDIRVFLPSAEEGNTLLFTSGRRSASAIAAELAEHGICTRSGMHCSPFAHKTLGTGGDAVRASFSVFNTPDEADRFLFAVEKANASG